MTRKDADRHVMKRPGASGGAIGPCIKRGEDGAVASPSDGGRMRDEAGSRVHRNAMDPISNLSTTDAFSSGVPPFVSRCYVA